jgi:nitrogen regulatory protein P-II 2
MKLITAMLKPDIVDDVVLAVTEAGAHGLTATEIIGFGQQFGHGGAVNSTGCSAVLLPKIRLDIAVKDEVAEQVVEAITKTANTGTIGDGKIWVSSLDGALRVRTGERDDAAL